MELSPEDQLRLNVLLAHRVEAIRIDEQNLTVHGLAGDTEARIPLNPNCRPEKYLRLVRELLSSHALGSPGGYPVFLQRWTRMGQTRGHQLDKLLLLGEPEAVIAVAGAAELSDELARRAWWCEPTMDNARRMLERAAVAQGTMGQVLAGILVEHLPFETDHLAVITTIKLILQPGLIDDATRRRIWARGDQRNAYHIGFLQAVPHDLPDPLPARADHPRHSEKLAALAAAGNAPAGLLQRLLDTPGQTYLAVSETLLRHPLDKFTVAVLLDTLGDYFSAARAGETATDISEVAARAQAQYDSGASDMAALREALPELNPEIMAMLALAHTAEALATPVIAKTSTSGTLLRRKLEPVINPLLDYYAVLRGNKT
jgi:hypothetical protein